MEWLGEDDEQFGPDRRVYFRRERTPLSGEFDHSIITMYRHPKWQGSIKRMRLCLAPGESTGTFEIDSFFTVYDTRHSINNPIFILACARYFAWTQDLDSAQISRMQLALRASKQSWAGWSTNIQSGRADGLPALSRTWRQDRP